MFTVARPGIDGRLAKTLTTSNPVESIVSIARTTNRNVTRWRDGQMAWIVTEVLRDSGHARLADQPLLPRLSGQASCKQHYAMGGTRLP
jgi:hypothetical protein